MTHATEVRFAIDYYKETGCDDFYSRNAHYRVVSEGRQKVLIEKELSFGAPENKYKIN